MTGRGLSYGGSLIRKEATGYGLVYITEEAMRQRGDSFKGKTVIVSGSGNVAIYACEKAQSLGAKVVAMYDLVGSEMCIRDRRYPAPRKMRSTRRARSFSSKTA